MKPYNAREIIAKRVAKELKEGDAVNLGIGIPTLVANYLPEHLNVFIHSENGFLGIDSMNGKAYPNLVDAGAKPTGIKSGGSMFDSCMSFSLIRGGHLDVTVLGALQVDLEGNLASWMIPGKKVAGMGGAMDLVVGAKQVIVAMEHTATDGSSKIVEKCTFPLTGYRVISKIITELAVFHVTEQGLLLKELQEGITIEMVREKTEAPFILDHTFLAVG
jgi:acetate CoA/acetoacetate CoA-transferase beta subunit